MDDAAVVLLPHTLSDAAATSLVNAFTERSPSITVHRAETSTETISGFEEASIVATFGFEPDWYDHLDDITWVQALTAGVDSYDLDQFRQHDVILTNASGVHAKPIAQQVLGYMLMFERNLHRGVRQQVEGSWNRYWGSELGGKTIGIIGTGAIGSEVARVVATFDTRVIGTKRDTSVSIPHVDRLLSPAHTDEVLEESDYLVIACPLTDETRGLIDAQSFERLSEDAVLINIARGAVVDESALITALEEEQIAGAGLDVFEEEPLPEESPLWDLPNAIITPHMAGSTPKYWTRCGELLARNYDPFIEGAVDEMENRIL